MQHALRLWKDALHIEDEALSYENMINQIVKGRMYRITPKKIKLFNESVWDVEDGEEPILELS